jgi:DNA gyrase subunit B
LLAGTKKLAKLAKAGDDRAQKQDVQEGLVAAVKVTLPEPQFRGQTKHELGTPPVQSIVYEIVKQGLADWFAGDGKKTHVNAIRDKITNAVLNRVSAKQALETRRKASSLGSTGMPDKLADCRVHGPDSELILVEGDSAAGPAKAGRNSEFMAILPLRGKVVNAGKSTMKQVLDNAEAKALFTAVGAGSGKDFNLADARYGRIIILCDADVDGSHIRCLLLTLIYHYMRPMLEAGRVYAAQPPLFTAKVGDTIYRAFSDEERDQITAQLAKGNRKVENIRWQRFKGLGEMNVEELAECALDTNTRILRRITMDDARTAAAAAEMIDVLMGSDVARRKDFLIENSTLFDTEALDI